ncbi:MAG: type IV secretion system DNA-binding domain-containing protein [Candidatus Paceibacterota bacterium]
METNNTQIQTVKTAPPPASLPILGRVEQKDVSFFGRTNYAAALEEKKFVFGIARADRRRNMYIVGKGGVGKTKLIELLMRQDISQGYGLCLLDPNGELLEEILHFIPEERVKDVVVVDPSDASAPVSFNPFFNIDPEFRHQMAEGIIEIIRGQFGSNWSSGMEHVLRFAILAVLDYEKATLPCLVKIFTDEHFRNVVANSSKDSIVARFWRFEYDKLLAQSETERNIIIPLLNKLTQILTNPMLARIFENYGNKISMSSFIESRKIVLINLAKARLGKDNSSFLAGLFILKLKQAGLVRMRTIPEQERMDFYLYIDEFHHYVTETFETLLFDGGKYHIPVTISHQYFGQVIDHFKNSVLANVGTLITFRLGGEDATSMEAELAPVFKAKNIVNLGKRQFYIKMMIDGEIHDPFSAETLKVLSPRHRSLKRQILTESAARYSNAVRSEE